MSNSSRQPPQRCHFFALDQLPFEASFFGNIRYAHNSTADPIVFLFDWIDRNLFHSFIICQAGTLKGVRLAPLYRLGDFTVTARSDSSL